MGNPSKDLIEAEGALRTVIESLIDQQEGFQKIGEAMKDEELKRRFLAESLKRAEFRGELENILHQEGVHDVGETGSAAGTVVRMWTGLKTAMGAGTPVLLEAAEEAEEAARQAYTDALDKFLPAPIREAFLRQAAHIEASLEWTKGGARSDKVVALRLEQGQEPAYLLVVAFNPAAKYVVVPAMHRDRAMGKSPGHGRLRLEIEQLGHDVAADKSGKLSVLAFRGIGGLAMAEGRLHVT